MINNGFRFLIVIVCLIGVGIYVLPSGPKGDSDLVDGSQVSPPSQVSDHVRDTVMRSQSEGSFRGPSLKLKGSWQTGSLSVTRKQENETLALSVEGPIRYDAILGEVRASGPGARFEIAQSIDGQTHRVLIAQGETPRYWLNGEPSVYHAQGERWLHGLRHEIARVTNWQPRSRAQHMLSTQGPSAVINELPLLMPQAAFDYASMVIEQPGLSSGITTQLIDAIPPAVVHSDRIRQLLELLMDLQTLKQSHWEQMLDIAAGNAMAFDSLVFLEVLAKRLPDGTPLDGYVAATSRMHSDGDKRAAIIAISPRLGASSQNHAISLIRLAGDFRNSGDARKALESLIWLRSDPLIREALERASYELERTDRRLFMSALSGRG